MGNIYVFLLAGHDTTAHTLAFALEILAIYPEIQQKAFEHIEQVLELGVEPVSLISRLRVVSKADYRLVIRGLSKAGAYDRLETKLGTYQQSRHTYWLSSWRHFDSTHQWW